MTTAKSLPYQTAKNGHKALQELQAVLMKLGCQSFGTMIDAERGVTMVQFKWRNRHVSLEASWKGYAAAWARVHPHRPSASHISRAAYDAKALEQAKQSVCSALRDWVKGQIIAVECGVMSFEAAFMPFVMLPDGRRVIDKVQADILPAIEGPK